MVHIIITTWLKFFQKMGSFTKVKRLLVQYCQVNRGVKKHFKLDRDGPNKKTFESLIHVDACQRSTDLKEPPVESTLSIQCRIMVIYY